MRFSSWSPKAHIMLLLGACWMVFAALALPASADMPIPIPVQDSTILVSKVPSDNTVYVGQTITYKIKITNKGADALRRISVVDSLLGDLTEEIFPNLNILAKNDSAEVEVEYVVNENDIQSGEINNAVLVTGTRGIGRTSRYVYNQTSVSIDVDGNNNDGDEEEGLEIEKTADTDEACPGDIIRFTITIRNTGDADLVRVRVDDDLFDGNLTAKFFPGLTPRVLCPGDELTESYNYRVKQSDIGTLVNKAKVSAIPLRLAPPAETFLPDGDEELRICAEDEAIVKIFPCDQLVVTKVANRGSAQPGTIVKFTISITNNGETPLFNVKVVDELLSCKDLTDLFFPGKKPNKLEPGQTITRTVSYKVQCSDPNPLINTVVVTACQKEPVAGVTLLRPERVITATASACVKRCSAGGGSEPGQEAYPDMIIYNSAYKNCTGDNIYNSNARGQVMQLTAGSCGVGFPVRVENDTLDRCGAEILITGTAGGNGWTVKYYDAKNGGRDITYQVTHGGWNPSCDRDDEMGPNQARDFFVVVTPNSGVRCGDVETVLITAKIEGTDLCDTVKACVKAN